MNPLDHVGAVQDERLMALAGEADAIARARTHDNADLERLIMDLQRDGLVQRTRSQVVLSRLVRR